MNLIEESFQNREQKKKSRITKIILIAIIMVAIIIIGIVAYLMYVQSTIMRLTLDGQVNERIKELLVFENDGTIYAPIKEIATYLGYESFNGEYSEKSEQQSKCYAQSENEVVNFELGQNKIYKLDLTKSDEDYEYIYFKNPVKAINGTLYISTEGLEKAFNISFAYNKEKNRITMYTIPYLYQYYSNIILDYGYTKLSNEFVNQKAILKNQLIVQNNKSKYAVIGVDGTTILEPKYDSITYLTSTGDFLVETNDKVGIMSANRETKVQIIYDSIEIMDSDVGLYLARQDNKYGVIDVRGNRKIHIENDQIGIDISRFSRNNIKNKYILADNLIPVKKDNKWALYDKNGNQLTDYVYDSFGYVASNNRDALNLLVIPDYNVLVACIDKKYTLINSSGIQLFTPIADDIYMTISEGEKHYYINVNDQRIDAEEWMDVNGVKNMTNTNNNRRNNNEEENSNEENQENNNNNEQEQGNEEEQQVDNRQEEDQQRENNQENIENDNDEYQEE